MPASNLCGQGSVMDGIVSPHPLPRPNVYIEGLTPDVTVFGNEAFKEVITVK